MTTTDILGLRLPAETEYYSLANHWNYNSQKLEEYAESLTGSTGVVTGLQAAVSALAGGVHLRGAVNYYADLPATPSEGDAYTVLYTGSSGTTPLGVEYAWASYNSTLQWVPIGVDPSVYARQADLEAVRAALIEQIDNGPKNKLEMTQTQTTIERYGVTATYDKVAGTVKLTGAHVSTDSGAIFEFYAGNASDQRVLPAGSYHLSGVPAGGSTGTYRAALTSITGALDTGSGADFTLASPQYAAYRILVSGNVNFGTSGMIFRPMICTQTDWAITQAFVPFLPDTAEIWAAIQALQA